MLLCSPRNILLALVLATKASATRPGRVLGSHYRNSFVYANDTIAPVVSTDCVPAPCTATADGADGFSIDTARCESMAPHTLTPAHLEGEVSAKRGKRKAVDLSALGTACCIPYLYTKLWEKKSLATRLATTARSVTKSVATKAKRAWAYLQTPEGQLVMLKAFKILFAITMLVVTITTGGAGAPAGVVIGVAAAYLIGQQETALKQKIANKKGKNAAGKLHAGFVFSVVAAGVSGGLGFPLEGLGDLAGLVKDSVDTLCGVISDISDLSEVLDIPAGILPANATTDHQERYQAVVSQIARVMATVSEASGAQGYVTCAKVTGTSVVSAGKAVLSIFRQVRAAGKWHGLVALPPQEGNFCDSMGEYLAKPEDEEGPEEE